MLAGSGKSSPCSSSGGSVTVPDCTRATCPPARLWGQLTRPSIVPFLASPELCEGGDGHRLAATPLSPVVSGITKGPVELVWGSYLLGFTLLKMK